MKKLIQTILLVGISGFLLFSCNDDDKDNIFPDKYVKIFSLKESGVRDLAMNTTQQNVKDSILILRGGGRPNSISNLEIKVLTLEEASVLGGYELDEIQIVPSDAYEITEGQNIKLEANEDHKYVPITFSPQKIYSGMKEYDDEITWVLPIALVSQTDTINDSQNKILLRFDVRSPLVEWKINEDANAEIIYKTLEYPITLSVAYSEENALDFSCTLDVSENEKLVEAYNSSFGTDYKILPTGAYSFDEFNFKAGDKETTATLNLSRTGLQTDETYLLPLKLSTLSTDAIEKTNEVRYLLVTNPKYVYKDVDRSSWKVVFSNNQTPWMKPYFYATSLIDDDLVSAWGTWWDGPLPSGVDDDFDYNSVSDVYPTFLSRRDMPNMVIVFDLGRETVLGGVGFNKSDITGDQDLKSCDFYLSDSFTFKSHKEGGSIENYNNVNEGNNWGKAVFTCTNIPAQKGTFWYHLSEADLASGAPKGRYLKFHPTESHRTPNLCGFNELYMKELISIDGNAVK